MSIQLTTGFSEYVMKCESGGNSFGQAPILQLLSIKGVVNNADLHQKRYKFCAWDGVSKVAGYFATQLNEIAERQALAPGVFIKLNNYEATEVSGKKLCIVQDLEVLTSPNYPAANAEASDNLVGANNGMQSNGNTSNGIIDSDAVNVTKFENVNSLNNFSMNSVNNESNSNFNTPMNNPSSGNNDINIFNGGYNNNEAMNNSFHKANTNKPKTLDIASLNPFQNNWTIKATVSLRSDVKTYNNAKGPGKLMNFHFKDSTSEIRATAFNEQVDKFFNMLQMHKTFYISGMRVGNANKKFSTLENNYELTFTFNTTVEPCEEEEVPKLNYNFTKIEEIENIQADSIIDLIAVVREVDELIEFTSPKTNKDFKKRDITLVDQTLTSVKLTLWSEAAEKFSYEEGSIVFLHNAKVGDFGGKSISSLQSTMMEVNPNMEEAFQMINWYKNHGVNSQFRQLKGESAGINNNTMNAEFKTLNVINDPEFAKDKTEFFTCNAVITKMNDNLTYPACPTPKCHKKLHQDDNSWHCAKCNQNYSEPDYRYILSCHVADAYGDAWVNLFNEEGTSLLGMSGNEAEQLKNNGGNIHLHASKSFSKGVTLSIMAKYEVYNDTSKIRFNCRGLKFHSAIERSKIILEELKNY